MTTSAEQLEAYQSGQVLDIDPGVYDAVVSEVSTVDGEFGEQLRFTFRLDADPDCEPWAWASRKLGTKTKLWGWFTALKGRPPTIGERVAPRDLAGCRCQVVVGPKKTRDGNEVMAVTDVLPPKRARVLPHPLTSAPAPTPAPPELADVCWCGQPVEAYSSLGVALCAKHAAELAAAN